MIKPFRLLDAWMAWRRRSRRRPGAPAGVLLLSCGGLGDTVLFALVLPRFLELARPGEEVTVLLRRDAAKMGFLFPPEVTVRAVDFAGLKRLAYRREIAEGLFRAHFRLVVATDFLRHPFLDEMLVAATGAPETAAMEARPWPKYGPALKRNRRLYTRLFESGTVHCDKVVRWTRFADWLTGRTMPPPRVRLATDRLALPARLDAPTVVVQPFSAVTGKQPPPELFRQIVESLPEGWRTVVTGAPADLERNPGFRPLLDLPGVSFDGSTFAEVVPLLRAARLVVSVDTALMHLAVAVGAPTLCLASAAYVGEIVPYDQAVTPENVRFIYHPMACEGCLGDCRLPPEDGRFPCIARLDAGAAAALVGKMLRPVTPSGSISS